MDRRVAAALASFAVIGAVVLVLWAWPRASERPMPVAPGEDWSGEPGVRGSVPLRFASPGQVDTLSIRGCGAEAFAVDGVATLEARPGSCSVEPSADVSRWRLVGAQVKIEVPAGPGPAVDVPFEPVHGVLVDPASLKTRVLVSFADAGLRIEAIDETDAARLGLAVGDVLAAVGGVELAPLAPADRLRAADALAEPVLAVELRKAP